MRITSSLIDCKTQTNKNLSHISVFVTIRIIPTSKSHYYCYIILYNIDRLSVYYVEFLIDDHFILILLCTWVNVRRVRVLAMTIGIIHYLLLFRKKTITSALLQCGHTRHETLYNYFNMFDSIFIEINIAPTNRIDARVA